MKKFRDLKPEELDKMEYSYRLYQKQVNYMIDLLEIECPAFKTVFEKTFQENIRSRNKYKEKKGSV